MNNRIVGRCTATYTRYIRLACTAILLGSALLVVFTSQAMARRTSQFMIPPPPPTPVLEIPPPPVMLPYAEAYSNYKVAPRVIVQQMATSGAIRSAPNLKGLNVSIAKTLGFGKPRTSYNDHQGPGAAIALPHFNGPSMNTWFDGSLRWYANQTAISSSYNALANQAPHWRSDAAPSAGIPQPIAVPVYAEPEQPKALTSSVRRFRHPKRIIANR